MILSKAKLKYYCSLKNKKFRDEENKFLIEGLHLVEECLKSDFKVECVIAAPCLTAGRQEKENEFQIPSGINKLLASDSDLKKLSETKTPQGIFAVVHKKKFSSSNNAQLIVCLDRINDPGNLGTIIRACHWYGVDELLISAGSVDVYNQKVIRASQGSIFHVSFFEDVHLKSKLSEFNRMGYEILLTVPDSNSTQRNISPSKKIVVVFGNEANGISPDLVNESYKKISIERFSNCESINAAMSCGIMLDRLKRFKI